MMENSEGKLQAILEAAIDFAIITLDDDGYIIDWNSGAEIMFGHDRKDVIGKHTDIIFTEEDQHAGISRVEIETAKRTGRSIDERWHVRKDGTRFFLSGVMTCIPGGVLSGCVKVARNITDRKLAEEALFSSEQRKNLVVQSAQMGEWEFDIPSNTMMISHQACAVLGVESQNNKGTIASFMEIVHKDDYERVNQQLQIAVNGLYIFQAEFRVIRNDNKKTIWVNSYGRVVAHENDRPTKMIGVIYDITSRKTLEKQKDDFIGVASHELKTPLTSIKVYSELLEQSFDAAHETRNLELLRKLNGQVERLVRLIQTLLDTSTLSEGRMKLNPGSFDLNELIQEQVNELQPVVTHHNILWKPGKIPLVHADHDRIGQVIGNFISNAIKYSPAGSDIIVSTEDQQEGVIVKVQDFGIGIPAEDQQLIFDRYYRVADKDDTDKKGFGLGLYICSEIIRQHHGTIGVEAEQGKGSTFYFTLPYT